MSHARDWHATKKQEITQ